ncbi:DUF6233 domain-containing protein [Streptomyces sp. NPDC005180]|uniref:DUF6233 domain-containing protein n=1 Tax=Streptomyces sp. NPDC005180 TaxID=3156868 RepID=UPI0033AE4266
MSSRTRSSPGVVVKVKNEQQPLSRSTSPGPAPRHPSEVWRLPALRSRLPRAPGSWRRAARSACPVLRPWSTSWRARRRVRHGWQPGPHREISREEALRAVAEGVKACAFCRPDSELRILE